MNTVITFDDYTKIGTMETGLSNHAEEAFFELSEEKQKIAEKIFKCLTETDRENREIRRATTIEKLCAVSNADLSEVADVIEVFRKEGRTFLMPPPDVKLNKNSLIDISHESLIRNWERLKKWVEEEGQSAQTYRRLAEDAFLHQKGKVGFWSEPELSDAIAWRTDFEPNETWAQLYKEKGERQYRASFAEAMQYLDDSQAHRDEELVEEEQQQEALRKYAANLRWAVIGLIFVLLATVGAAAFAVYQMNEAVRIKEALVEEKKTTEELNSNLELKSASLEDAVSNLKSSEAKLSDSLEKQTEATEKAEEEKERADKEAELAKLKEAEKQKALEEQKKLSAQAKAAEKDALKKKEDAEKAEKQTKESERRAEINRTALTYLEQNRLDKALTLFEELLKSYQNDKEPMSKENRADGKWWTFHNIGIVHAKGGNFFVAQTSYKNALEELDAGKTGAAELTRNRVTTLRRLAQVYRDEAKNLTAERYVLGANNKAVMYYSELVKILEKEPKDEKPSNRADVWVELADIYYDLYDYEEAINFYKMAEKDYEDNEDLDKQIGVLKKWSDAALAQSDGESVALLNKAVGIQENKNKMDLSPVHLEIADSYDRLAKASELAPTVYGNRYMSPLFSSLFDLIRKVNFSVYNKTVYISDEDVSKLANAYVEIGKCRRAEEVYKFAIKRATQSYEAAHYVNVDLFLYNDLADFYQNILRDDGKAQEFFDKFVEGVENETVRDNVYNEKFYIRAGDFYAAKGDHARAGKLYEYALAQVKTAGADSDHNKAIDNNERDRIIELILAKSEIITKIARLFEARNKLPEAEARYLEAVNLVVSKGIESHPLAVRALIAQADFYEKTGDQQKAQEIYNKAEANLNPKSFLGSGDTSRTQMGLAAAKPFTMEKMVLHIHIRKKLGDINRENAQVAAGYYKAAFGDLETYERIVNENLASASNKESTRYSKGNILTNEYWTDSAEILEALGSLPGITGADAAKKRAGEIRENLEKAEDYTCYEDKGK